MRLAQLVRVVLADTLADLEGIAGEFRIQAEAMRSGGAGPSTRHRAGRTDPAGVGIVPPDYAGRRGGVGASSRRPS